MLSVHHKLSIQHHLASLLNLSPDDDEEYIADILDQLLSIENPDDVAEYLSNFVVEEGSGDVNLFVEELGRFKSGEEVKVSADSPHENEASILPDTKQPANTRDVEPAASRILDEGAAKREEIRLRELEAREKQREEQERLRLKKEKEEEERRKEAEMKKKKSQPSSKWENMTPPGFDKPAGAGNVKQPQTTQQQSTTQQSKEKENTKQSKTTKKSSSTEPSKPLKGTPKIICGCFGNLHAPLTNCLHCGRISCEREGYSYCPFCNNLISQFIPTSNDSATAHKERLLEYDRTSASRTHVHDDQEDYFVTESSMWSSAEEMEEARGLEEERRKRLHERQNQVLDIKF